MMFDTLVGGEEEEDDNIFKDLNHQDDKLDSPQDPILQYLHTYQFGMSKDLLESATDPDLSWDEGDIPKKQCIQVWSFNDFMEQYNQIYAWLNNIQVQYHDGKKKEGNSPRVEGLLKDLDRDIEKRERFRRECGRMVGMYPELEPEVRWRVEHVMSKWDMLTSLRNKSRNKQSDLPDIYSDIELDVRCLREWLKEMDQRIDTLQFSKAAEWNTRDRERKMAEFQVLQTDIESHGRIVKLVLSLCKELSLNPGLYDLERANKVAKNLEKKWQQIWLRSLEWQCLLEEWIQDPRKDTRNLTDLADTDEEPLTKIPRMEEMNVTPNFSPAATLLRVKRRKRWLQSTPGDQDAAENSDHPPPRRTTPRSRRRISDRRKSSGESSASEAECPPAETAGVTQMRTSETSESGTNSEGVSPRVEAEDPATAPPPAEEDKTPTTNQNSLTSLLYKLEQMEAREMEKLNKENVAAPLTYWDSSDEDTFSDLYRPASRISKTILMEISESLQTVSNRDEFPFEDNHAFVHSTPVHNRNALRLDLDGVVPRHSEESTDRAHVRNTKNILDLRGSANDLTPSNDMNMEVFSLDSLEVPDIDSFQSTKLLLTGGNEDSLDDVSSDQVYRSSGSSSQGLSLESLVSEDCLPVSTPSARERGVPRSVHSTSSELKTTSSELKTTSGETKSNEGCYNRRARKKNRKRSVISCVDDSQSDLEMETFCSLLLESTRNLEALNLSTIQEHQQENFVRECSENINLLLNLLQSFKQENSFISKKKNRETRMLLNRWERTMEAFQENFQHSQKLKFIKEKSLSMRESILSMMPGAESSLYQENRLQEDTFTTDFFRNQDDLSTKLQKYRDNMSELKSYEVQLSELNLSLHTLKAQLGSKAAASCVYQLPNQTAAESTVLAVSLQQESILLEASKVQEDVSGLYTLWERCHHVTSGSINTVQETLDKLKQFETQLFNLKNSLRKDAMKFRGSTPREGSCDSGISDASTEHDFPLRERQLEQLRSLAKNIEKSLDPRSKACSMISKTLETTSYQLKDLQLSFQKLKSTKGRAKQKIGGRKPDPTRFRLKNGAANSRRRRVVKLAVTINLLMMLVVFLSWLTEPRCCDSIGSLSLMPQLKYVNGPPPI